MECLYMVVALSKKGLDVTPKTIRVNLNGVGSNLSELGSVVHRKRKESVYLSCTEIIRKAFSISPMRATL